MLPAQAEGFREGLGGEMLVVVAVVVNDATGLRSGNIGHWQFVVGQIATAVVVQNEDILAGRELLCRPVDIVGKRVAAAEVGIAGADEMTAQGGHEVGIRGFRGHRETAGLAGIRIELF